MGRIAYYAHDHGSGHLRHAENVARHPDFAVQILSSATPTAGFDHRKLERDVVPGYQIEHDGPFHYVPTGAANVQERFRQLHAAFDTFRPDVVIVDVSAEVAAFAKLCGYPTIVRRMHGDRTDHAHEDMYALADRLIAYFPEDIEQPLFDYRNKTHYVGMVAPMASPTSNVSAHPTVVVQTSLGGAGVDLSAVATAARATPQWQWDIAGVAERGVVDKPANLRVLGVVDDVAARLSAATVVITSAGHNAVRAAAAAHRPVIVFPEPRPYDEQLRFSQQLSAHCGVTSIESWNQDWAAVLLAAQRQSTHALADQLFVTREAFHAGITAAIAAL